MKIGVFSDIHDNLINLKKALDIFKKEKVEKVIFCGDLVSPFVIDFIKSEKFEIPIIAIRGNNEGDIHRMMQRIKVNGINFIYPEKNLYFSELEIEGRKIAIYHGDVPQITECLILSKKYDVVITGHNHEAKIETINGVLHVNPGTVCGFQKGLITNKASLGIYDSKNNNARIIYF